MRIRNLLTAAVLCHLQIAAIAQEKKPLTVDDIWSFMRPGAPSLSSDGSRMLYTISVYDPEENRMNSDIWEMTLPGGQSRRITTNPASDSSPVISPDGTSAVFLSKRDKDKASQIYLISLSGGEAERLTDMPLGVSNPKWFPDGKKIAFVAATLAGQKSLDDVKKAVEEREKNKVKAFTTESRLFRFWDHFLMPDEFPHVFSVEIATKKVTDLIPDSRRYLNLQDGSGSYDVSPDGKSIVFEANSTEPPYRELNSDIFLVAASGGEVRNLTATNPANDTEPVFSPDGKWIAYGLEKKADGWPDRARLALLETATGKIRVMTEEWDNVPGGWTFTPDGKSLVFHSEVRARVGIYSMPIAGGTPKEVVKGGWTSGVTVSPAGDIYFLSSTLSRPNEIHTAKLDGSNLRALTRLNDEKVAQIAWGEVKDVTFKGAGDAAVQMFVVYPPGFDAKRKYPLVHLVHGGPVGTFGDQFHLRWNAQAFAAPGYIVAAVNFHGSSSFGQDFVESILGAHPDKPAQDILKATDFLIAQGSVDGKKVAAAGGSYGGFLVNWLAGSTNRFATLVSHAGVYSLLGQFASDSSYGRQHSYGGYPFTNLANIEKWSPNRQAKNFQTPMLILHGEKDYRVPVTQGLEIYGTLQAKGIPARLVYYPDENHWVMKGLNAKHWYGEVLGWLGRYLK
jgi:dipeptidyl aminopeptidase/acylaminoacyl peptidase